MRETLLALAYPLILSASAVYAGCSCWWRRRQRRRGVLPSDVHPAFLGLYRRVPGEEEALEARLMAVKEAERVVRAADVRLGPLYERPVPSSDSAVVRLAEVIVEAEHARTITER